MFKKMTYLISLFMLQFLVSPASAMIFWDDGGIGHLWSTPANWSPDSIPTRFDPVSIDDPDNTHCEITNGIIAECETLRVGNGGATTNLDISGGSLTASGAYVGVDNPSGHGILNISGGLFSTGSLQLGWGGTGTLNMTGGTIELSDNLEIPGQTGKGSAYLHGGTINASDLRITSASGSLDITTGKLILEGDDTAVVQSYIDKGWITSYDGQGRLNLDYDVTSAAKTTLTATAFLNPNPADGDIASSGEVELSWTLPDPCVPGQPVLVDVYFTDNLDLLKQFTDPAAIQIVSRQNVSSVRVQTQPKTRYYWAVDTYVGSPADPIYGPIFSFIADNQAPSVMFEQNLITTWLTDGAVDVDLDATVTDDGFIKPYTVTWSVVSEPNEGTAVIKDAAAEDTTVSLSATGRYVLQLQAYDGEYTGSATVTIDVYADGCEAAKSLPGFELIPGDINEDCIVNELDLAILESHWLESNALVR